MIKMLCQVSRKPEISEADFYPRYLTGHGDLVRSLAKPMGFLRYVQAHRIASSEIDAFAAGRGWRAPTDGQSELWWESWGSMEAALGSPDGAKASALLEVDEQAFTDTAKVSAFIAREEVIFDFSDGAPPGVGNAVKMVVDVWKRPGLTADEFSARWLKDHGDLVRTHAKAMGFSKYVQNHRDPESKLDFAELRGWVPAPDGVTEVWWPNEEAMKKAMASPEAVAAGLILRADEEEFIDPGMVRAFLAKEHSIFDFIDPVATQPAGGDGERQET
jgi:hypothetical protein